MVLKPVFAAYLALTTGCGKSEAEQKKSDLEKAVGCSETLVLVKPEAVPGLEGVTASRVVCRDDIKIVYYTPDGTPKDKKGIDLYVRGKLVEAEQKKFDYTPIDAPKQVNLEEAYKTLTGSTGHKPADAPKPEEKKAADGGPDGGVPADAGAKKKEKKPKAKPKKVKRQP